MSEKKDFLDQFSDKGKPESFKEEERVPVVKQTKPLDVKRLAIFSAIALVLLAVIYFLFFAPKIEMPDFVGKSRNDVAAWVKQQQIESAGIIINEVYNFDNDEGTIMSQSVNAGKKVKKNVKINFEMSLGADPDEKIKVPDLKSMSKQEILDWIAANKLLKTKVMTSYHDEVEDGEVIDYSFTGVDADEFTRNSTLRINVSKGPAPAGNVTVEDFEKKPYETVEAWAKAKKINLVKSESYSEKVESGYVISQSIPSGRNIKEGETLNVVVSKGHAIYMPNMVGWNEKQLRAWQSKNPEVTIYTNDYYSSKQKGTVLSQSVSKGSLLTEDKYVELRISLGDIVDLPQSYVGSDYHSVGGLHDFKDEQNAIGAGLKVNKIYEFSDTIEANCIIRHDNSAYVDGTLTVVISKGRNILLKDVEDDHIWEKLAKGDGINEDQARQLCQEFGVNYVIKYIDKNVDGKANGDVVKATRDDGEALKDGYYCPQSTLITIYVVDKD